MESNITIPTPDDYLIHGILRDKGTTLVIFVHGLAGNVHQALFYNASRFFANKGYATFCFDLYSGEEKGRLLSECSIETHAADVTTVLKHFCSKYDKIYLVGHSLGGPSILL